MQTNLRKFQGTLSAHRAAGNAIARERCVAVFPATAGMVDSQ